MEKKPAAVPERAKQAGEARDKWFWVEPEVWTDRMLTAPEKGVKGGKWFSLIDKVYALETLRIAFSQVQANNGAAGVDHQTIKIFEAHLDQNLSKLSKELKDGKYSPRAIQRQKAGRQSLELRKKKCFHLCYPTVTLIHWVIIWFGERERW